MKFLIVGASGFLGAEIMKRLRAAGYDVVGTRNSMDDPGLVHLDLREHRLAERFPATYFQDEQVFVIVCASICQIDRCYRERETARVVNVDCTLQLLGDAVRLGGKPLFISTSYVFDGVRGGYQETDNRNPICEYGRHKAAVERYLEAEVPDSLILRLDKLVADRPSPSNMLSQWMERIQDRTPIVCVQDQIFAATSISDVSRAIQAVCERDLSGMFHVAASEYAFRDELARKFVELSGVDLDVLTQPLESFPFDDPRPLRTYLDNAKFIEATGMSFTPIKDVMTRFLG